MDFILTNDSPLTSEIKNKGFSIIDTTFKQNGWHRVKNELNWLSYTNISDETSFFDIKIFTDKIIVSVPIKNSIYQYVTSFKGYFEASEYVEQKFYEYIQ